MFQRLLSGDYPRSKVLAVILVAIFVGLAFAPFLFPGVKALNVAAKVLVFVVLVASFDLLLGYTGIVSFAHTMFFGIGAYGIAVATTRMGPTWAALGVGIGGALIIGLVGGFACLWGVHGLKKMLGADDAFDVFGVHGLGGIIGAILTAVFASQSLGGTGGLTPDTFAMGAQLWIQVKSVLLTIVWSGVVSFVAYKIADLLVGLRVPEEAEREGLDITSHGETAYNR